MKQFARCSNCRQWYKRVFTTPVEVYPRDQQRCVTVWCLSCIQAAEQRSQWHAPTDNSPATVSREARAAEAPTDFQQLTQEHLLLMERALHEEDSVLVPLVEAFVQHCQWYHLQVETPELRERLSGHVRYWQTFLNTLQQSH